MKKMLLFAALVSLLSCQKSDTDSRSPTSGGETKPQYDNTAFGVYKGIFVGSTGIIKIEINNGNNIVKAYIFLDEITKDTLTCTTPFTTGQAIVNAHFVGRISSMDFNVNANGTNPSLVNFTIVGHSEIESAIIHETSTQQVFCYQGSYDGSEKGNFDCMRFGTSVIGLVKSAYGDNYRGNGQVVNNSFSMVLGSLNVGTTFQGTFSGDGCSGTWANPSQGWSGNFSGVRTL